MNMWYTIIQCTVILGLSSNNTHSHPNTLPIRSLPGVNFWVFHPRDLSLFLIYFTQAFTFHHYFIFFFLFPFHALFTVFILSSHNHDANNAMRLITLIHKYHLHHINFQLVQISLELESYRNSKISKQFQ